MHRKFDSRSSSSHESEDGSSVRLCTTAELTELEVEACMRDSNRRGVYQKYAQQTLHMENVRFMVDSICFLDRCAAVRHDHELIQSLCDQGKQVYDLVRYGGNSSMQLWQLYAHYLLNQYIASQARMEVNIPAKHRIAVRQSLDILQDCLVKQVSIATTASEDAICAGPDSSDILDQRGEHLQQLASAMEIAFIDIRRLIACDCWPRFVRSALYAQYLELVEASGETADWSER